MTKEKAMREVKAGVLLMAAVLGCASLSAQEKQDESAAAKPESFYKFVFRVIETSGNGAAARSLSYSQIISDNLHANNEIRTGDKLPIATGPTGPGMTSTQFQYVDVGTQIDTHRVKEFGGNVQAEVTAKFSSIGKPTVAGTAGTVENQPVIRQCQWDSIVTVPLGKPTVIFSSDNPSDKGKTELELTATPIR